MRRLKLIAVVCLILFVSFATHRASAGPYADDMAKCLVKATSPEDRALLVKWVYGVMSLHPDLAALSAIQAPQRDALTKSAGALYQRLLIESCKSETQQAVQNEGPQTLEYAFQILGQVAMRGIMSDPQVLEGVKGLGKAVDQDKIKAVLTPSPPK
jgi:hypothetical protein